MTRRLRSVDPPRDWLAADEDAPLPDDPDELDATGPAAPPAVGPPTTAPSPPSAGPLAGWRPMGELGPWLEEAPPPREYLMRRDGDGALPRRVVGLFAAPGGRGKTMCLVQLTLSVATGRPWLGTYHPASPGRVVLALAEETQDEIRRRLYYAAIGLGLTEWDRRLAERNIIPLGLAAQRVALVDGTSGVVQPSGLHAEILGRLAREEHSCVILDPLARWAPGVESDNAAATGAIQALEQLTCGPGNPTVLVAHHTNKWSQREGNDGGSAVARGVTGLVDGVRWVACLTGTGETDLEFAITKSNYGPPEQPVPLARGEHGILRRLEAAEIAARSDGEAVDCDAARVRRATSGVTRDAAALALAIGVRPGLSVRELRAEFKSRGRGGVPKCDAALAVLKRAGAVTTIQRPRGRIDHHLDGRRVPEAVLAQLSAEDRTKVAWARPPEPPAAGDEKPAEGEEVSP